MLNLSNELIFTCANHDSAVIASKNIGEREVVEKSWGWAAGKRSYQLPARKSSRTSRRSSCGSCLSSHAIIRHCEKPFRKTTHSADQSRWLLSEMVHSISVPTTPCANGSNSQYPNPRTNS